MSTRKRYDKKMREKLRKNKQIKSTPNWKETTWTKATKGDYTKSKKCINGNNLKLVSNLTIPKTKTTFTAATTQWISTSPAIE
jgi:hypothetical protein